MANNLVIVESPSKAKTIEKYLGKDYKVLSSFGHIRDLPKKDMSVDIDNNFEPTYVVTSDKKKRVAELRKAMKSADLVWLASDSDREGEAIAWHLHKALKLTDKNSRRITFNEITKSAVESAIKNPREINQDLVDAQQARRVLDRVVGYELSPLLWRKVQPGLSAGRVQSVAVKLIVDRERKLDAFEPESSFRITANLAADDAKLEAKVNKDPKEQSVAKDLLDYSLNNALSISAIEQKPGKRNPSAPFTTSSLQQTASNTLGYSPKRTMMLAQRLYESGDITYMRTDSLSLSKQALAQATSVIKKQFGDDYHQFRTYKSKSKNSQEAHEAIRPTDLSKASAGADSPQKKLYDLIRVRTLASQMAPAKVKKTTITVPLKDDYELRAKGEVVTFEGWMKLAGKPDDVVLPSLSEGDELKLVSMEAEQRLSRGPARYTEASLVRQLEELEIGRPSTYAPTISTIQDRGYVEKGDIDGDETELTKLIVKDGAVIEETFAKMIGADRGKLLPTSVAIIVTDFLAKHFTKVMDYDFTAELENKFDKVAVGDIEWQKVLKDFYPHFHDSVEEAQNVSKKEASQARKIGNHPDSGKPVFARLGRYGPMLQHGDAEDDEKPEFAPLPDSTTIEKVTMQEALKAFELPRVVGKTEDGEEITANVGRYGPYVKVGKMFVSIGEDGDPHAINEKEARKFITEKKKELAKQLVQDFGDGLQIKDGRYGPYVTNGKVNAKIPKDKNPEKLTEDDAKQLIKDKKSGKNRRKKRSKK